MADAVTQELQQILGGEIPGNESLSDAQRRTLLAQVKAIRHQQHRELVQAMEGALGYLPALLRSPIRKIFGV